MKHKLPSKLVPTYESVVITLKETAELLRENSKQFHAELLILKEKFAENERKEKERAEENERKEKERAEKEKERAEKAELYLKRSWKEWQATKKEIRGVASSNGDFAEEYFENALYFRKKDLFGEEFYKMQDHVNGRYSPTGYTYEYDIVLYNEDTIVIVEVKYKARKENFDQILKMPETFRTLYPEYDDLKIYLVLASLSFTDEVEKLCREYGIATLSQVGDTAVFFDENAKAY